MRRSSLLRNCTWIALLLLGTGCGQRAPVAQSGAARRESTQSSIAHFEVSVLDLDGARAFLQALDFRDRGTRQLAGSAFEQLTELAGARADQAEMSLGQQSLLLTRFLAPKGRALETARANDTSFEHIAIVVRDMDVAYRRLGSTAMRAVSPEPQLLPHENPVAGGVRALYFRDPEGHFLELLQFPPDKGDPEWHADDERLFLGIDHSAIATADTQRSLRFYRDVLGLRVVSKSVNEGREQERLSGVAGARVEITSLRGDHGPGLELLEYLAPTNGKPFPPTVTAADSLHWEIAVRVAQLDDTLNALRKAGPSESRQPIDTHQLLPTTARSAVLRDPDGHSVRLFEAAPGQMGGESQ